MSLRLYGIIEHDGQLTSTLPAGVQLMPLRELAAVVEEGEYAAREVTEEDVERHFEVVTSLFGHEGILPIQVGTLFRSEEVLQRWMELHYVALSDALAWVHDRVAARVHITRGDARREDADSGTDLAAVAAEVTRNLRRRAVSSVPLRREEMTGIALSAAYLVERELWDEFGDAVREEAEQHRALRIELTGPWPPYDFVRLQFGG